MNNLQIAYSEIKASKLKSYAQCIKLKNGFCDIITC